MNKSHGKTYNERQSNEKYFEDDPQTHWAGQMKKIIGHQLQEVQDRDSLKSNTKVIYRNIILVYPIMGR